MMNVTKVTSYKYEVTFDFTFFNMYGYFFKDVFLSSALYLPETMLVSIYSTNCEKIGLSESNNN